MKPRSRSNRYRDFSDIDTASETEHDDDYDFFHSPPSPHTVAVVSSQPEAITKKTYVPLTSTPAARMATRSSTRAAHMVRMQMNNDDVSKPRRRIQTPFHPFRTRRHVALQKHCADRILKRRDVEIQEPHENHIREHSDVSQKHHTNQILERRSVPIQDPHKNPIPEIPDVNIQKHDTNRILERHDVDIREPHENPNPEIPDVTNQIPERPGVEIQKCSKNSIQEHPDVTIPKTREKRVGADQSIVNDVYEGVRRGTQETERTKLRSGKRSVETADMEGSKDMERHKTAEGTVVPTVEETTVVPTVFSTTTTTVHNDVVVHASVTRQPSPALDDVKASVTNGIKGVTDSVMDGVTVVPTTASTVVHSVSDDVATIPATSGAEVPHNPRRPPSRVTEDDDIVVTYLQPSRKRPSGASESERAERLKERRTLKMEVKEEEEDIVWIKDVVNNGSADSSLVNMEFDRLQFLKPIVKAEQSAMGMEGAGSRLAHSLQAQTDSLAGVQLHSNEFLSPGEKSGSNNNNNDNIEMKGVGEPAETVSIAANTETETVEQGDVRKKDNDQDNENLNASVPADDHVFHRTPSPIFLRTQYGNVECPEGYGPDVVESDITEIKISSTHRELAINIFLRRLSAQSPPSVARPEPQFAPSRDHVDTKYGRIFMPEGFRCCRCRMNTTDYCGVDGQLNISILVEMEKKSF